MAPQQIWKTFSGFVPDLQIDSKRPCTTSQVGQGTHTVKEYETQTHALQFRKPKPCGKSGHVKKLCFGSPHDIGLAQVALIKLVKVALSSEFDCRKMTIYTLQEVQ